MGQAKGDAQVRLRVIVAAALATIALMAAVFFLHSRTLDGVSGVLCLFENTRYAPGYSDMALRRVTPGMTEAEALRILGPPLSASDFMVSKMAPDRSLFYSYRIQPGAYRLRTLLMFRGRVDEVVAECTVD